MTKERELLRQALRHLEKGLKPIDKDILIEDIRDYLDTDPEAEPLVNNKSLLEMIEEIPRRIEPLGGQRYSYVRLEEVKYVIDEFVARHPPRPAETEAEYDFYGVIPLTHRKAKGIIKDRGYHVTGFVLSRPDGDKCIVDMSAVRWLSGKEFFEMMHPVVTSPTAETEAEPVAHINLDEKRLEWAVPFEFKSSCFVLGKLPLYLHPPRPDPARKPLPEKIDPILRILGSMRCSPSYVAGWNNCIDAMSNGAEARKPMTHEEIIQGVTVDTSDDFHAGYWAGVRFAEKHHGIGVNQFDPDSIDLQSRCRGDKL